jgi:hypothetical protein
MYQSLQTGAVNLLITQKVSLSRVPFGSWKRSLSFDVPLQDQIRLLRKGFRLLEKCFHVADTEGNGVITRKEFRLFLSSINGIDPPYDDDELDERMAICGVPKRLVEQIDFRAFIQIMSRMRLGNQSTCTDLSFLPLSFPPHFISAEMFPVQVKDLTMGAKPEEASTHMFAALDSIRSLASVLVSLSSFFK